MTPLAIDKVLTDSRLLGAGLGDIETWATWTIALEAAFALPLMDEERKTFAAISGGRAADQARAGIVVHHRPPWWQESHGRCVGLLLRALRQAQARRW
jgi:hypothetical protein